MKKYNKHYVKRNPATGNVIEEDNMPVLGEIAKSGCPLEDNHVLIINKSWKSSGIYLVEVKSAESKDLKISVTKNDARLALEAEATELGIKFRENIGDDKLQEKINEAIEK